MAKDDEFTDNDPSVPTELLELFVELDREGIDPEDFKETMGEAE